MREMKDSGIGWIGFIPKEWDIHPVYYYFYEGKKRNYRCQEQNLLSLSYGKVKRKDINTSEGLLPASFNTYNIVKKGDIIIRPTDLQNDKRSLRTGLVLEQGIITSAYLDLVPRNKKIESRYFHYLLHSYDVMKVFYNMGNGVRQGLNYDEFSKLLLLSPSTSEQKAIADFLDMECKKIDEIMADVQSEIDVLDDYKKSVIDECITHGLDKNVNLKESNVPWCPFVPESWQSTNPKALFYLRNQRAFIGEKQLTSSQGYGIVYQDEYMELTGAKIVLVDKDFGILKHVEPGDFVISMRSFQGGLEYSEKRGCISSAYVMLIPNLNLVYPRFYKWVFKSQKYINAIQATSNLIRDGQAMRYTNFCMVPLFIIPMSEQRAIADYLDKKCADIDSVIADKKSQLDTLEEYKKSLIYEYVTGKKEVSAV